ncbi:MAG: hypothetical protein WC725_02380 [Patescibacteria group bacterium]|jgi:hypothetical protein
MTSNPSNLDLKKVKDIIDLNFDSHQYFYSQADERWLDWLWENGFMDPIKSKAENLSVYSYRMPELNYLVRMAQKVPEKVVDLVLQIPISPDTFNPEVVDQFLWIAEKLPPDQLARLVPKIYSEKWVTLMGNYSRWGIEYQKMLETLSKAGDNENLLILIDAIFSIRTKEDLNNKGPGFSDNPFYLNDLSHIDIFGYINNIDSSYLEKALAVVINVFARIVLLGSKQKGKIFSIEDSFHFYDVDFFTITSHRQKHISFRDDVRELAATVTILLKKVFEKNISNKDYVMGMYGKYINILPDSRTVWRLKLYVFSLCPEIFKVNIRNELFRIFDYEDPGDLIFGAEYERLIQACFSFLSSADQRLYVSKVIDRFKAEEDLNIHGSDILSSAFPFLTEDEKIKSQEVFGKLNENYNPQPTIGEIVSGTLVPKAPGNETDWSKTVPEIIQLLRSDWAPANLVEKYGQGDFLHPIDGDGVAERLKKEFEVRTEEFLHSAQLFFDHKYIDPHYTYAFIQKITSLINEKKFVRGSLLNVLNLSIAISKRPVEEILEVDERKRRGWLANWNAVYSATANLMRVLLQDGNIELVGDFSALRDVFFYIIQFLLSQNDPAPKDEIIETAKIRTKSPGNNDYEIGDPYTTAINSVRGKAFQAFINFVILDVKFGKSKKSNLSKDVKDLYENVLINEKTRAIMFMFGHYLPAIYYQERDWALALIPSVFTSAIGKEIMYLAAWEGYLSNNLYKEMFFETKFQELYEKGLNLNIKDEGRRYFRDPDESISTHMALAFMHYEEFDFNHRLFKLFWADNTDKQSNFISFIGRMFITGRNTQATEHLKKNSFAVKRLNEIWEWVLKNNKNKCLNQFGYWLENEKEIFDIAWLARTVRLTLEKIGGTFDWDYGLTMMINKLAEVSPDDTLVIANLHLLIGGVRKNKKPFHVDTEWFKTLDFLYKNKSTKLGVYSLINSLIHEGGSTFWGLKEIIGK